MLLGTGTAKCCRLCEIANGSSNSALVDSPWLSDEQYVAFVSIGALLPGWSLVAPRRHRLNLAEDYKAHSFWSFVNDSLELLERQYGKCVAFEHGSQASQSATSCGTAHAHIHLVPFVGALSDKAKSFDSSLDWERIKASEIDGLVAGREYLFVADQISGEETEGYIAVLEEGRSQFFRRVIAAELGRANEFDYRAYPQLDIAERSAQLLISSISAKLDWVA